MKVLADCVPVLTGGGVQVAIAFLSGLRGQSEIEWSAVLPSQVLKALPQDLAADRHIIAVGRRSQLDRLWLTDRLHRIEREAAPDAVFTIFGPPFFRSRAPQLVGFALPNLIYKRDALMPRAALKDRLGDWLRCRLFRRADHLVTETETARQRLAQRLDVPLSRISVIPNSVNPLLKRPAGLDAPRLGPFAVLVPSAYYWHKNLEIVPIVAAEMRRRDPGLDFVFRFTLDPGSPEWIALAGSAQTLGAGSHITTLGVVKITALASAYAAASAVYLPSLREVSTAVYPESFFFRRPLVAADMDFARELCGDAALFVPPRNAAAAAEQLVELAHSEALKARLIAAGERRLAEAYPAPATKLQMQLDLLKRLAANVGVRPLAMGI
jgi:glycosyltransferase involved in cell wall biosynthesis